MICILLENLMAMGNVLNLLEGLSMSSWNKIRSSNEAGTGFEPVLRCERSNFNISGSRDTSQTFCRKTSRLSAVS